MRSPRSGTTAPRPTGAEHATADAAVREEIARAWASLADRADAIGDDIALTLLERDRELYEQHPTEMRADVRRNTREHIRRGIASMAHVPGAREHAVELWRETGRRRARQGVPMEFVLNAYTLGTRVLWEALMNQRHRGDLRLGDHALLLAGQSLWAALDVQNAVLVEAYRRENARLQRRDLQRQQSVLDGLLEGRGTDTAFARDAREVLGIGVDDALACVVAPFDGSLEEPLRSPEDRLERLGVVSRWHVRGGLYFGLLASSRHTAGELPDLITPLVAGRVGVAPSPEGLRGFATAFELASRVVDTLPQDRVGAVAVRDRLPEVLLGASPEVTSLLVQETLGPVLAQPAQHAQMLLSTLAALVAHDGSPKHAAEQLICHRNTVIYRMKQIEQLTGRSLADPRDKLLFSLGLMATGR